MAKKKQNPKKEPQAYDKILRENIGEILFPLAEKELGIPIKSTQEIKDKIHTTLAREGDFFRIVTTQTEETFLLHIEFQVADEPQMIYRMQEYYGILRKKYQLPIKQFVYYLGEEESKMQTRLAPQEVFEGFQLLSFHNTPYKQFLDSTIPEEIILALLADFGEEHSEAVISKIMVRLQQLKRNEVMLEKYVRQMLLLARLRTNLPEVLTEHLEQMAFIIDIENDTLYLRGMENGIKKGIEKGEYQKAIKTAERCLKARLDIETTANLTELSIEEVKQIAKKLGKE